MYDVGLFLLLEIKMLCELFLYNFDNLYKCNYILMNERFCGVFLYN